MDCFAALYSIGMLGALLSNRPGASQVVFEQGAKTIVLFEGDFLAPGLEILEILPHRRVRFRCNGTDFSYSFWAMNRPEEVEEPPPIETFEESAETYVTNEWKQDEVEK